ncbi:MAG: hypothetical protein J5822_04890 [Eubacteriaceae bacterium]|nr:hypothetical protein [Eubacteriaceae bacterium]
MTIEKFTYDELEQIGNYSGMGRPARFNTPITPRENMLRLYQGKTPMWIPSPSEMATLKIDCDPENIARSPGDGPRIDGYGVEWIFVDSAGGAMVRPGNPKVKDINEWEKYVTVPDPETWDWEGCYERQKSRISDPTLMTGITFGSCLFERLIAVMDFENAAMALFDEDQHEGVHRFFRAITDYRKKYYALCKKWFNPDTVNFNDDWGTQKAETFSMDIAREMLVPYVKDAVSYARSLGMYVDLHCCGFVEHFVPFFIEEGFSSWGGQPINDKPKLKKMYPGDFIFTHSVDVPADATDEEVEALVLKFMDEFGYDNRGYYGGRDERFRKKLYEVSRQNYDRLVAEGKAIL